MKIQQLTADISLKRQLEGGNEQQLRTVREVLANVKVNGDTAVKEYSAKWDGVLLDNLRVSTEEIQQAVASMEPQIVADLTEAAANVRY